MNELHEMMGGRQKPRSLPEMKHRPSRFKVEIHKRSGGYSSTPFRSLALAKDFLALHMDGEHDLVELKEWQPDYREEGWRVTGAWVVVQQFSNGS